MLQALGLFAKNRMARRILWVEHGHAFITSQRFDPLPLLLKEFGGQSKLLDRFRRAVLLLEQSAITHQAVGRLREGTKKPHKNSRSFSAVTRLD